MKKLLVLFSLAGISPAFAHAFLKSASPAVGSTVSTPPSEVVIIFTEDVEPAFCKVQVVDGMGMHAETAAPQAVPGHPDELRVPVKFSMPGRYYVTWHALSVDTHKTQGGYSFTIAP